MQFDLVILPLLTLVSGFVGVWLASRLATRGGHEDRVWHRKAEAFSDIFEAYDGLARIYGLWMDIEFAERTTNEEFESELQSEYKTASIKLRTSFSRNDWLLNDAVKEEYVRFNKAMSIRHETWFEHLDEMVSELKKSRTKISSLAASELSRPKLIDF